MLKQAIAVACLSLAVASQALAAKEGLQYCMPGKRGVPTQAQLVQKGARDVARAINAWLAHKGIQVVSVRASKDMTAEVHPGDRSVDRYGEGPRVSRETDFRLVGTIDFVTSTGQTLTFTSHKTDYQYPRNLLNRAQVEVQEKQQFGHDGALKSVTCAVQDTYLSGPLVNKKTGLEVNYFWQMVK